MILLKKEQREQTEKGSKQKYTHLYTPEQRAKIAKYAAESGNSCGETLKEKGVFDP